MQGIAGDGGGRYGQTVQNDLPCRSDHDTARSILCTVGGRGRQGDDSNLKRALARNRKRRPSGRNCSKLECLAFDQHTHLAVRRGFDFETVVVEWRLHRCLDAEPGSIRDPQSPTDYRCRQARWPTRITVDFVTQRLRHGKAVRARPDSSAVVFAVERDRPGFNESAGIGRAAENLDVGRTVQCNGIAALADIGVDIRGDAPCDIALPQPQERVLTKGDFGRDAGIVNALIDAVIIRGNLQQTRRVPVGAIKAHSDRIARLRPREARERYRRAIPDIEGDSHRASGRARQGDIDAVAIGGQTDVFGCNLLVDGIHSRRIIYMREDQNLGAVVIDHLDQHIRNHHVVIGLRIRPDCTLHHRVAQVHDLPPFGQRIIDASHRDVLDFVPVGRVEHQIGKGLGSVDHHALATGGLRAFGATGWRDCHCHLTIRRAGQGDAVGVVDQQWRCLRVFEYPQRIVVVKDDDPRFIVIRNIGHDIFGKDRVIAGVVTADRGLDQAVVTIQAVGHDRDCAAFGHIIQIGTSNVDVVAAQTTDDFNLHVLVGAFDKEGVVPLQGIDDQLFEADEADKQTAAKDAIFGDHIVVAKFAAHDGQAVKAVAAINPHRRINVVGHKIGTLPAIDVRIRCCGIIGIDAHERPHKEAIVVFIPEQEQFSLVGIDGKVVLPRATVQRGVLADPIGQEAKRHLRRGILVAPLEPVVRVRRIARAVKELANLEGIIARVTKDVECGERIIEHEQIVAIAAIDLNIALKRAVILHFFKDTGDLIAVLVKLQCCDDTGCDRGVKVRAEEEQIGAVGPVDLGAVSALPGNTAVQQADQSRALARQTDLIEIRALLAIKVKLVSRAQIAALQPVFEGLFAVAVIVDPYDIVPLTQFDLGLAAKAFNVQDIIRGVVSGRYSFVPHIDLGQPCVGAIDMQFVVRVAGLEDQSLEAGVFDPNSHAETDNLGRGQAAAAIGCCIAIVAYAQNVGALRRARRL